MKSVSLIHIHSHIYGRKKIISHYIKKEPFFSFDFVFHIQKWCLF